MYLIKMKKGDNFTAKSVHIHTNTYTYKAQTQSMVYITISFPWLHVPHINLIRDQTNVKHWIQLMSLL